MSELNFYPAGYEAFLDSKKWKQNKWSRDSLYLSLEEENESNFGLSRPDIQAGGLIVPDHPSLRITPEEREYLYNDNRPINKNMTADEAIRLSQWKEGPRYDEYFKKMNPNADPEKVSVNLKSNPNSTSKTRITYVKEPESIAADSIVSEYASSAVTVAATSRNYLAPSKVLAFWKKEFNNTNLATREFEKRVQVIHQKCYQANTIIDKYTSQLQKPMWQIDKEVAAMGYPEFEEFATENVGVMDANNPHIKGLKAFYENGIDKLKKQNKTYQDLEKKRQGDWDKDMSKERSNEQARKTKRTAESLDQEYKFNMNNVKKHLGGKSRGFTIKHGKGPVMKNIDAYVREATIARQTTTVIDPTTGNKTKIKYNSFNFEVPNADKYLKLYTYVFPNKTKAFQRITGTNGKFDYNLNDGMIYDIAVVGITKDGYEYFQKMSIKKGSLGMVDMKRVSEAKLDASVKQLNNKRTTRPMKIDTEMDWLVKEQKDYKEQKMRTDMFDFRSQLRSVVFPCYSQMAMESNSLIGKIVEPEFGIEM
ncbi:MAG: hypothetical protein ACJAXI_001338 [Crocinitomicaceae bacterium]|jgi:hypothetical protein